MKKSELWQIAYDNLSIKHKEIWSLPLQRLDILLEMEFRDLRSK
jgi:hypothetical protein